VPSARRILLAIEISNPSSGGGGGVAVGRVDGGGHVELLAVESVPERSPPGEDRLMPAIVAATARAGVGPGELVCVAASVGPGGYTAVRVACATAKLLALGAGCACAAVRSAAVAAASDLMDGGGGVGGGPVAVALASKGDSAWFEVYARAGATEPTLAGLFTSGELDALGPVGVLLADGFLPAPIRAAAAARGLEIRPLRFDPAACLRLAARARRVDPAELNPLYPREPDAVTLWRARTGTSGNAH
jgi:tRNA threonylcarbamoyladenosine biosynthesis protein TsaB